MKEAFEIAALLMLGYLAIEVACYRGFYMPETRLRKRAIRRFERQLKANGFFEVDDER